MLESLRHSQDVLGVWLVIFTALIGVGIVGEDWDKLAALVCSIFEYIKGDPFDRSTFKFPLVFAIVVMVGVVGEAFIEFEVPITEQGIRTESDKQLATLRSETAKANERAATLENENLKMRLSLGPRRLTKEQRDKLKKDLRPYPGIAVDVFAIGPEEQIARQEVLSFAKDIASALEQSSMNVSGFFALEDTCPPLPEGVMVGMRATGDLSPERYAAGYILEALKSPTIATPAPYVTTLETPSCQLFSTLSEPNRRSGFAKIRVIVTRKPAPILK